MIEKLNYLFTFDSTRIILVITEMKRRNRMNFLNGVHLNSEYPDTFDIPSVEEKQNND